jgi:hypothetical protein
VSTAKPVVTKKDPPKVPVNATCSTCPYRGRDFQCHYWPPQMSQGHSVWPTVKDYHWCAQHPLLVQSRSGEK